ncbi:MAG: hypothetical protein ACT4NX_10575 [Deltaproteobacteria bacterium]
MAQKKSFGEWLRGNAEKYLLEAAADDMAARYPEFCSKPYRRGGIFPMLWRGIFVPLYLAIPWNLRKRMILRSSYGGERPHWKRIETRD